MRPPSRAGERGRVLATGDHFATVGRDLVVQAPTRGVRTLYSRAGDAFAWARITGTVAVIALAARRRS